jgi:hypothetical protein
MRIFTFPRIPRTILTTSECSPLGGIKSVKQTSPSFVTNVVSTIIVPGTYRRRLTLISPSGRILQNPFSAVPSSAAKHAPEANVGQQSQSIDPSRLTSAPVSQSPMTA